MPAVLIGEVSLVNAFSQRRGYPSPLDRNAVSTDYQDAYVLSKTYSDILAAQLYSVQPGEPQSEKDMKEARDATELAISRVMRAPYESRRLEGLTQDIAVLAGELEASTTTHKSTYEIVKNRIFSEYMTLPKPAVEWAVQEISNEGDRMQRLAYAGCGFMIAAGIMAVVAGSGTTRRRGTMLTDSGTGISGSM
jgi:hypothetical protein